MNHSSHPTFVSKTPNPQAEWYGTSFEANDFEPEDDEEDDDNEDVSNGDEDVDDEDFYARSFDFEDNLVVNDNDIPMSLPLSLTPQNK